MGTQTSATQVEGGGLDNDITRWAEKHKGWAAPNPGLDHWNHVDADNAHLQRNGHNAHGFTVDWSRIEPREGEFDAAAMEHYRQEIVSLKRRGMEPIVTLLHYAIPPWLEAKGGILNPRTPALFERFTRECVEQLGADVTYWNTMNEPNTLAAAGFLVGLWPPGETSIVEACRAFDALLRMHAASARGIHEVADAHGRESMVSFAHNIDLHFAYQWWNPADQTVAHVYDYLANRWFLDAIAEGKSIWPVGNGEVIPGLAGSLDYLALNYYGRTWTHVAPGGSDKYGSPLHDMPNPDRAAPAGFPYDADGIYQVTLALWNQFHLPVMIAESGIDTPDTADRDTRGRAIVDTLAALHHCQRAGVPVLGYLHWTDWDSPEWHDGWSQHYGLFGFDHTTGRTWDRDSADVFESIARRRAIPQEWLSDDNLQAPAERDGHCAKELRELLRQRRSSTRQQAPRARQWLPGARRHGGAEGLGA